MKQNKLFLGLATMFAAAFTFTACTSDDAESQSALQDRTIRLTSSVERGSTRATSDPQSGTSLSTSSNLAIWAINTTADPDAALTNGNNEQYTVNGSGNLNPKTTDNTMTWPDGATLDFYAYAPYSSTYSYNSANGFSVQTDQKYDGYLASDLVWAKAENKTYDGNAVELQFSHLLTKVNISISKEAGSNVTLTGATVYITGTKNGTTFNPSTGAIAAAPTGSEAVEITAATLSSEAAATVCAIIIPQTLDANTAFVKIVTADNSKTLIAKLDEAITFDGSNSYNMSISVGTTTAAVNYVSLKVAETSLVQWTDKYITQTTYGVGDYLLASGEFIKKENYVQATHGDVAGIIFSTKVSETDAALGYNAYIMGLCRKKRAFPVSTSYDTTSEDTKTNTKKYGAQMDTGVGDFNDAFNDLDGRTHTYKMMTSTYYTSLTDDQKTKFMANLSWFTVSKGTVASDWYLPSFGQLIQIINNLGGLEDANKITSSSVTVSNSSDLVNISTVTTDGIATALTQKITDAGGMASGGETSVFTNGNINYISSTENNHTNSSHWGKVWQVKFNSSANISVGKNLDRSNDENYSVIPVAAVIAPAIAVEE